MRGNNISGNLTFITIKMLEIFNSTFFILAGLVFASIYWYFRVAYSYWKERGVPTLKPIPPFGNFAGAFLPKKNVQDEVRKMYQELKDARMIGLYRFDKPTLLLRDPELIKEVLVKEFDSFYSRGIKVNEKITPLQGNLFSLSGSKWRNLRVKLTPTFTSGKMKMMFPTLVETGKELQKFLQTSASKEETLEIKEILARYSTDIIASCAFGIQCNSLQNPNSEFRTWGRRIFTPTFKGNMIRFIRFFAPAIIEYLKITSMEKDISDYFRQMVRETVEYREEKNIQRNDFLQLLIQLKNKTLGLAEDDQLIKMPNGETDGLRDNVPFEVTMDVMAAQAFVFFLAGFETSSTTMTFCLYELALNPDIQDRLRAEIDSTMEENGGQLTYDSVMEMEYLEKVVSETLRKHSPAQMMVRECTKDVKLRGTNLVVEKGTQVIVPILSLHHDPKYFPEPERFDPERFNEEEKKKRPNFCYLPFGEGPRICIGMRFGLMQTKVGLCSILSDYEVKVSEKTQIPLEFDPKAFVLSPMGGMWLKIVERRDRAANLYCFIGYYSNTVGKMLEMFNSTFLILAGIILASIYLYFQVAYTYWKKRGVRTVKPMAPFGNFPELFLPNGNFQGKVRTLYEETEGEHMVGLYRFDKPTLLVRDPELLKEVLVKNFDSFYSRGIKTTSEKQVLEISDILGRYSTDVIASCAFGIQCNCLENPDAEFRNWGKRTFTPTLKSNIVILLELFAPSLLKVLELSPFPQDISKYFRQMVRETVEFREKENVQRNDFMQLLIQLKNKTLGAVEEDHLIKMPNGETDDLRGNAPFEVTLDVMAAQAFVFFLAGFETSSTTMSFCLYELALNPDIQDKLRAEIDATLEKNGGELTYDSVMEMEYMDKVVSETLRKHSPAQMLVRECTKDTQLRGTHLTVEKGTLIFTKVGLCSILSDYEVQVSEKTQIPLQFDPKAFVLSPKGGMWLKNSSAMLEIFSSTFLFLGGLVSISVYLYFKSLYSYWKNKGVPSIRPVPIFGNFAGALLPNSNPQVQVNYLYDQFKGERLGGLYRFMKPALLLRDPELIKEVLVKDFDHFFSRGFRTNVEKNPLQGHLFALSGPKWRNLRVKLTPTFTSGKMKMMFPTLSETGEELKIFLQKPASRGEVIEIKDVLARYSTDIIASCAFGIQCNCLKNPDAEFRVWGRRILAPSTKASFVRILTLLLPVVSKFISLSLVPKDISDYFRAMVRETVEYREKNNVQRNDFMQLLIQMKNKTLGVVEEDNLIKMPNGELSGLHANAPFEFNNTFLILGGFVLLCLYLYIHVSYSYWKKRDVPFIKPIPPFGNFIDAFLLKKNPAMCVNNLYNDFKGEKVAGLYQIFTPSLMIRDPELIKEVMLKDFQHFFARGINVDVKTNPLAGHLFILSGPKWRNLRVRLTPTFTSGKMKMMFPTVSSTGEELKAYLKTPAENKEVLEIKDVLARYSTDIIASCAFGIQCNCLKNPKAEFREWGRKIFTPSVSTTLARVLTFFAPSVARHLKLVFFQKEVTQYFRQMVRETVEYREKYNVHRNDFMQLLIQMKNKTLGAVEEDELIKVPEGEVDGLHTNTPFEVTMDVMAAQAFVFFIAGFETSSTTMTFCLYELAVNPHVQDRVRAEIDAMFEKNNGKLEYDALMQMEYLDKVVNETLRKYPPVSLLTRECTSTTPLRGTDIVVEKGTPIMLPVYSLHHDPQYFPDPERFDPERFSEEEKQKRPHYCYLPFGEGPRLCIGMRFGLMQTKVGLISVLSNYEVHVSEKTPVPMEFDPKSIVLAPKGGLWLKVTERRDRAANKS
ncbi:hypothetical protein C0J52_20551 [Blattella germanica]|nr:hypothetical protein C0J52_20551 [Blattella germanica]